MPRRRHGGVEERTKDRRYTFAARLKRKIYAMKRAWMRRAFMKLSDVINEHHEIRELVERFERELELARLQGYRNPALLAWLRMMGIMVLGEKAFQDRMRVLAVLAAVQAIAEAYKDVSDYTSFVNPPIAQTMVAEGISIAVPSQWELRAIMRREADPALNTTVVSNQSRIQLTQANQVHELARDPWLYLLYATLQTHPYCHSSHGLAFHDGTPGARLYHVVNYTKVNDGVEASFGAFQDVMTALSNTTGKPENETITMTLDMEADYVSPEQNVTIATTDSGSVRIEYPLYFVIERPSRIEAWRARQLGRREARDMMRHCSVYRAMRGARLQRWKTVRYKGKVIRVTVRTLRRRAGIE